MEDVSKIEARKAQAPVKGRGTASYVTGRYVVTVAQGVDDGWGSVYDDLAETPRPHTEVREERARSVISSNDSPDVGFSQSINPYRGCEHGCVYCFARPSHAYLELSPGLDFETKLFARTNAAERLREELARRSYQPSPIALGINTDACQPIERRYRITRQILELLAECRHPLSFVTKSAMIERDIDLLAAMARQHLVTAYFSVTTLDNRLAAKMEPRASASHSKLKAMRALSDAGVPVGVLLAPVIPMITDSEIEHILDAAHAAGARAAGYVLLRLPHELKQVWREWLQLHYPERTAHVMSLIRQMHGARITTARSASACGGRGRSRS